MRVIAWGTEDKKVKDIDDSDSKVWCILLQDLSSVQDFGGGLITDTDQDDVGILATMGGVCFEGQLLQT